MPILSELQYSIVTNVISLAVACLGGAAIFFFIGPAVSKKYRFTTTVSGVLCSIACYHYFRIYNSFVESYALTASASAAAGYVFSPTGEPFNNFYRYADWLVTVPLLIVELISVLALAKGENKGLTLKLCVAAAIMILLGYPGEISGGTTVRLIFWAASMIPFLYILFVLFTRLGGAIDRQPDEVRGTVKLARGVLLVTWLFYPAAYLFDTFASSGAVGEVGVQVGYSIADILAKAGFGLIIYTVAKTKSELESPDTAPDTAPDTTPGTRVAAA